MRRFILSAQILLAVLFVAFWELAARYFPEHVDPNLFGQPSLIAGSFLKYLTTGFFLEDTMTTVLESMCGLVLGMFLGLLCGVLLANLHVVRRILGPYLVALNSMPRPALAPLFLLWFGLGISSKIVLSFSLVFFIVFFNTLSGLREVNREYWEAVQVTGASRSQIFRMVALPSVYSWLFAGFKTSVSFSIIGSVVGEFVGASSGLGYRIMIASGIMDTHLTYAILIWLGVLGTAGVAIGGFVEKRVLRWQSPEPSARAVTGDSGVGLWGNTR